MKKSLLIISIGFLPNIGGLETHLKDLIQELVKRDWRIVVLTYQPLNTPLLGKWIEKSESLMVVRLPVLRGVFYKLLKFPLLEFLFLGPLLFLALPAVLLKYPEIKVVNAQGIIAGFAAAFWTKIFKKKYVVSAQSVYHFSKSSGLYKTISRWIFTSADKVIAISKQTAKDIETLGVEANKIHLYTNWEDSRQFRPQDKIKTKEKLGFEGKFIVSFFGRLVEEKGVKILLQSIKYCHKKITFVIYGEGPLGDLIKDATEENDNVIFAKTISPEHLPLHYSAADIVVMPTQNDEGFGRVAAGALLCGTPVIASNRGALPEVVDDSVGKIINPTAKEIAKAVNLFYSDEQALKNRAQNARKYALSKFSNKNVKAIIQALC